MPALVAVGILVAVQHLRPRPQSRRRHDQQRLVRRRPRLDPDDRMLGGARETAVPRPPGRLRAGRGQRLSRRVARQVVAVGAGARRHRRVVPRRLRWVELEQPRARERAPRPSSPGRGRRPQLPGPLRRRADGRVQRLDQGGDTVGEGQAYGMLLAAADRRPAALRQDLELDEGQPPASGRADLVPLARWPRGRPPGRLRRRPRREPRAAGRRLPLQPIRSTGARRSDSERRSSRSRSAPPPFTGRPGADRRSLGGHASAGHGRPELLRAGELPRRCTRRRSDPRWEGLAASSRAITSKLMPGPGRLPPDWAHLQGDTPVPIGDPSHPQSPPQFGFDAVRTLVRFAEDPNPAGRRIAARAWPAFENQDPAKLPVEHDLSGRPTGHTLHPVVLVAAAGAADAAGHAGRPRRPAGPGRVARPALADLLRRGVGGARADHADDQASGCNLFLGPSGAPRALRALRQRPRSTRRRNAAAVGRSGGSSPSPGA